LVLQPADGDGHARQDRVFADPGAVASWAGPGRPMLRCRIGAASMDVTVP
jgi:hypothetical protein